ncbi:glycosyl transferase family 2 [Desulfofarcimen acetoxidans DSM 771]|uniref:Glycosyl transferase family 2 n=1 Tax=Desulfofarcimen acetoxidans (strain ATCC 49208 / DSM 771 / KCTC 5769 / VKM B-1644 / 5575) TaxID=485916 RepID=C8W4J2_DESAS|nr:glycosyltransferase [Desulfofarcimen acetoxidans]ACV63878.1 glycosyl transferase family 2 [Desulfofarcimen acetoxidans DSM 771]
MNKLKVCVYAICKNEEKFVDRWVDSMCEADIIIVTDTGSTDNTVEKLRQRGVTVYINVIKPWRFDKARNSCLEQIPGDVDICVSTDLDEVFEAGWRENLEKSWIEGATRANYYYAWSFCPDGTPGVTFHYDRIHSRQGYKWVNPVHECLSFIGDGVEKFVWCPYVRLLHYPDSSKDRSSYLTLLELAVAERPEDPRNYHYLGREYMFAGMWNECIENLKKHLSLPNSCWKEERSASMRFIARAFKAQVNYIEAKSWLYKAIAETPYLREPYVEMAKLMYEDKDWAGIYHMVMEALKIKERSTYINDAWCWDYTIYDLGALACYYLGLTGASLEYAQIALEMSPNDERLKSNYEIIKNLKNQKKRE